MDETRSRLVVLLCLFAVIGAAGVAGVAAETPTDGEQVGVQSTTGSADPGVLADHHVGACAATPPADHADPDGETDDVVGWVDGYWYDEALELGDELDQTDLEQLTKRTAARVEALRCHTFESVPPIQMVTPEEFQANVESEVEQEYDQTRRQFENAKLVTLLKVGTDEDAVDVIIENQAAFPTAYYRIDEEYIGFLADDPEVVEVDQVTLAHELLHALQDQHFDLDQVFEEPTADEFMASLAVVEGDAVLLEERYRENCGVSEIPGLPAPDRQWAEECHLTQPETPDPPNWALTLEQLAAYHAPLVEQTYEAEGWSAVDGLLEAFPDSTVEALYPERYGVFERLSLSVPDESDDEWTRLESAENDTDDTPAYDIVGQHGLTAMLAAPYFEANYPLLHQPQHPGAEIIDFEAFIDPLTGEFSYGHPATEGWQGDRFHGYATDDGVLGGVWKLAWEDASAAERFADRYRDLLEYRGGEQTTDSAAVYTLDGADDYEMAVGTEVTGDRVWVVTAPSVDELDAVHGSFDADSDGGGPGDDDQQTDDTTDASDDTADGADDDGAGLGVIVAIAGVVLGASLLGRRM